MANATDLTIQVQTTRRGRAVNYAEELGLNKANEEAVAASEALGILYHQYAQAEDSVRRIKALIAQQENNLLIEASNTEGVSGPTATEREYKLRCAGCEKLAALNADLLDAQTKLGEIGAEVRSNERSHRTAVNRMSELGGYFSYLAASKEALTAERLIGSLIP